MRGPVGGEVRPAEVVAEDEEDVGPARVPAAGGTERAFPRGVVGGGPGRGCRGGCRQPGRGGRGRADSGGEGASAQRRTGVYVRTCVGVVRGHGGSWEGPRAPVTGRRGTRRWARGVPAGGGPGTGAPARRGRRGRGRKACAQAEARGGGPAGISGVRLPQAWRQMALATRPRSTCRRSTSVIERSPRGCMGRSLPTGHGPVNGLLEVRTAPPDPPATRAAGPEREARSEAARTRGTQADAPRPHAPRPHAPPHAPPTHEARTRDPPRPPRARSRPLGARRPAARGPVV